MLIDNDQLQHKCIMVLFRAITENFNFMGLAPGEQPSFA